MPHREPRPAAVFAARRRRIVNRMTYTARGAPLARLLVAVEAAQTWADLVRALDVAARDWRGLLGAAASDAPPEELAPLVRAIHVAREERFACARFGASGRPDDGFTVPSLPGTSRSGPFVSLPARVTREADDPGQVRP